MTCRGKSQFPHLFHLNQRTILFSPLEFVCHIVRKQIPISFSIEAIVMSKDSSLSEPTCINRRYSPLTDDFSTKLRSRQYFITLFSNWCAANYLPWKGTFLSNEIYQQCWEESLSVISKYYLKMSTQYFVIKCSFAWRVLLLDLVPSDNYSPNVNFVFQFRSSKDFLSYSQIRVPLFLESEPRMLLSWGCKHLLWLSEVMPCQTLIFKVRGNQMALVPV